MVTKHVQGAFSPKSFQPDAIVALVDEGPGFLAFHQIDAVHDAAFPHHDRAGYLAQQGSDLQGRPSRLRVFWSFLASRLCRGSSSCSTSTRAGVSGSRAAEPICKTP